MNKKQYIAPCSTLRMSHMKVFMHPLSDPTVNTAAWDLSTDDVGVQGIGFDNHASGPVSFGNDRGPFGGEASWEDIW